MTDERSTIADPAALAERLRLRERQLKAVVSVTQALQAKVVALDELLHHAVLAAMSVVEADAGSILLHDPAREKLVFRHVEGPTKETVTGMEIEETQGIAGEVFHTGEPRISTDVMRDRAHILDIDRAAAYHTMSMVTVPLRACTGETIGVLQVLNKRTGPFDADDLEVLQVLGTQIAVAIVNAQLFEQARAAVIIDLLGQISHDIKNLLTPVSLAGQTLRVMLIEGHRNLLKMMAGLRYREENAELLGAVESALQKVDSEVVEVIGILEESTQIAQLRAKEIADSVRGLTSPAEFTPSDLDEIVQGVCRVLQVVAEQHGVALSVRPGGTPTALLDSRRIYNAVYNLVDNAIGATPRGGNVTVVTDYVSAGRPRPATTVSADNGSPHDYLELQVIDTGCGMPSEIAAKLFGGNMRSTKPGGTGLGSRVVKNVMDAHGGQLTVDSVPKCGTRITARIPFQGT